MNKIFFWSLLVSSVLIFCYLVSDILAPFIASFIFAYILQPLIDNYSKRFKLSKELVSIIIFLIFISSFGLIVIVLVPVIYQQFTIFVQKIPKYEEYFHSKTITLAKKFGGESYNSEFVTKLYGAIQSAIDSFFTIIASLANHIWDYTIATINLVSLFVLVPIILYYFLRDWDKMVFALQGLMPEKGRSKIREIFIAINELLSAYIRGQLNICIILALYYIIGLNLIGIDLALLIGLLSGFLIIIPFIGAFTSFIFAALSCYISFDFGYEFLYVVILYTIGHTIEGYILAPRIIGDKIGLHPVWIIFSVFAAGSLLGFIGILFAIPLAGIVKVLIVQFINYYKSTKYFRGES